MKKVQSCEVRNCIPTPSGCIDWDGGDIESLGICNGDPINSLLLEIIKKLEDITGEDLSSFDLDSLLDVCNIKAPSEVTLINILNVVKENQLCLKDFVNNLSSQIASLSNQSKVNVDLECYQQFDNIGNALAISRDELDKIVINNLCLHGNSIETLNGKITGLQSQIDGLNLNSSVEELTFATCVDTGVKPTSSQVMAIAQAHCDLEEATGSPNDIQTALSKVPSGWNTKYNTLAGWNSSPSNWAEVFGNLLLVIGSQQSDIEFIQSNCCAISCDDIKLGFSVIYNESGDGVIIKFSYGAGTVIPNGITDKGSTGTIKDVDGNIESFALTIANNAEIEIPITGLNTNGDLTINISAKVGNDSLTCEKCLNKVFKNSGCAYCQVSAEGVSGSSAILIYDDGNGIGTTISSPSASTTTTSTSTTTTSTTTTTTVGP